MKTLLFIFALITSVGLAAVEVAVGDLAFQANTVTGSSTSAATGAIIYGGVGDTPGAWSGKIVLLDRGAISFAAKVKTVQDAGGLAVVIADNVAGVLPTFTIAPSISTIPAVAVTQATGSALKLKAGEVVRVGPPVPKSSGPTIPDPTGHSGEALISDGAKYVLTKSVVIAPSANMYSGVVAGKPIDFSVSADGTPPFTFQWLKDGVPISGATAAAMHIGTAQASDAGAYACQVTNPQGTAVSAVHNLSVIPVQ